MTPAGLAVVVTSSTPLWYFTRATGLVALVLLTASMALGVLISVRYEGRNWPRYITIGLHRNMSLLALLFTAAHVATTILDSYVPIHLVDAFVPFIARYRPVWLGLGAIAFDLLIALTVTSLLRTRLGYRSWRLVHWAAYLCWPVAVLHGLGTGSDTRTHWVLLLTGGCVLLIAGLAGWRLAQGWPARAGLRVAGAVALIVTLIAGSAWLVGGPLRPGWAHRSGAVSSVLDRQPRAGLPRAGLPRAGLPRAGLHRAGLHRAGLHRAGLHRADLHRADLHRADLHRADPAAGNPPQAQEPL